MSDQAMSPEEWLTCIDDEQDRWTITLPANTRLQRQAEEYFRRYGERPPAGWRAPALDPYVKVTVTSPSGRARSTVLKTKTGAGGSRKVATIAPGALGRTVTAVTLSGSTQAAFRKARFKTTAGRLQISAVAAGACSAVITVVLAFTGAGTSSLPAVAFVAVAAFLAAGAPWLGLLASGWFRDEDVPDR